jgi:hypothetical protein
MRRTEKMSLGLLNCVEISETVKLGLNARLHRDLDNDDINIPGEIEDKMLC